VGGPRKSVSTWLHRICGADSSLTVVVGKINNVGTRAEHPSLIPFLRRTVDKSTVEIIFFGLYGGLVYLKSKKISLKGVKKK
jgi:hypothetical protein